MTTYLRRSMRRPGPDPVEGPDVGTSLAELIVSMLIYSVIAAVVAATAMGFWRVTSSSIALQDQIESGRAATEASTQVLRTAVRPAKLVASCPGCATVAFLSAGDFAATFYANYDNASVTGSSYKDASNGPLKVTLAVSSSGVLTRTLQQPDPGVLGSAGWTYCDPTLASATAACKARASTTTLANGVQRTNPVFAYYDTSGIALPTASGVLTAAQAASVDQVEVTLSVQAYGTHKPTTYIQRVSLPN